MEPLPEIYTGTSNTPFLLIHTFNFNGIPATKNKQKLTIVHYCVKVALSLQGEM